MSDEKETITVTNESETISLAEIRAMGLTLTDFPECEEYHFEDIATDTLAPHELIRAFPDDVLDDLDYRAKAIIFGWHAGEEQAQNILAIANALPKLTAALRKRGAPCS